MKAHYAACVFAVLAQTSWSLNKNQSIPFLGSQNRNASTDADAAFSNPAGTAFLPSNGLYLALGNQIISRSPQVSEASPALQSNGLGEYKGNIDLFVFPTLQAAYKMDDLTLFFHGGPLSGGGTAKFDDGLPMFDGMILGYAQGVAAQVKKQVAAGYNARLAAMGMPATDVTEGSTIKGITYKRDVSFTGSTMTLGGTFGVAYKIHPNVSVAAAYRYCYANTTSKGTLKLSQLEVDYAGSKGLGAAVSGSSVDSTLDAVSNHVIDSLWRDLDVDVEASGMSHGVVLGLDVKPSEAWNLGLRFEWNSELELENETSKLVAPAPLLPKLSSYADGATSKATEPMVVAWGVSYSPVPRITLESSMTLGLDALVDHDGEEENYHNSLYGGLGLRTRFGKRTETAISYTYDWTAQEDKGRSETNVDLPTHYIGASLSQGLSSRLRLDVGAMWGIVEEHSKSAMVSGAEQIISSDHLGVGFGVEWSPGL